MEIIEAFVTLLNEHGYATVLTAMLLGVMVWKGRSILAWIADTYNAAQVVKLHQQTIAEQRKQIELMQEQLDQLNQTILNYVEEMAVLRTRLERYEDQFAKRTARKSRKHIDNESE